MAAAGRKEGTWDHYAERNLKGESVMKGPTIMGGFQKEIVILEKYLDYFHGRITKGIIIIKGIGYDGRIPKSYYILKGGLHLDRDQKMIIAIKEIWKRITIKGDYFMRGIWEEISFVKGI